MSARKHIRARFTCGERQSAYIFDPVPDTKYVHICKAISVWNREYVFSLHIFPHRVCLLFEILIKRKYWPFRVASICFVGNLDGIFFFINHIFSSLSRVSLLIFSDWNVLLLLGRVCGTHMVLCVGDVLSDQWKRLSFNSSRGKVKRNCVINKTNPYSKSILCSCAEINWSKIDVYKASPN